MHRLSPLAPIDYEVVNAMDSDYGDFVDMHNGPQMRNRVTRDDETAHKMMDNSYLVAWKITTHDNKMKHEMTSISRFAP